MTYKDPDGEGTLELNTMELLDAMGWEVADCFYERANFIGVFFARRYFDAGSHVDAPGLK